MSAHAAGTAVDRDDAPPRSAPGWQRRAPALHPDERPPTRLAAGTARRSRRAGRARGLTEHRARGAGGRRPVGWREIPGRPRRPRSPAVSPWARPACSRRRRYRAWASFGGPHVASATGGAVGSCATTYASRRRRHASIKEEARTARTLRIGNAGRSTPCGIRQDEPVFRQVVQ
ncbi:MAG: hypothetical protein WKF84_12160 [Pyrinomonadaceae bacterium]